MNQHIRVENEVDDIVDESGKNQFEDNYEDDLEDSKNDDDDDDMDLDYSQTHLDQFLSTQNMKGTNVQSSSLVSTFLSSMNRMKGTARSGMDSQNKTRMQGSRDAEMAVVQEKEEEQSVPGGNATMEARINEEIQDSDDELDRGRDHEIDLQTVSTKRQSPMKAQKPILTPEQVSSIKQGMANKEEEKKKAKKIAPQFDVGTKEGMHDVLLFQMRVFDQNYNFDMDMTYGQDSMYMARPTEEEIYYYCKYVIIQGRMEKEIPILCLIYIERFLTKTGLLMNHTNWKRLTLISLLLASKIWDDDSLENVHFP